MQVYKLIEDVVKRNVIIDIGGGIPSDNRLTIDINPNASVVHDLNVFPWPVKDNSCMNLRMSHVLEHLDDPLRVMQEIYRIATPSAILEIRVPWWKNDMFSNPAHKHCFKPKWFHRLHPKNNAWSNEKYDMTHLLNMNWEVIKEKKIRGRHNKLKIYEYRVWLGAVK